jgi:hypothetical protein
MGRDVHGASGATETDAAVTEASEALARYTNAVLE